MSGFVTAHFAALNEWIASFGPIGYWTAGLIGTLLVAVIGAILARIRLWWLTGGAIDKWKKDVVGINPLDAQFTGLRIRIHDLAHPVSKIIKNKAFFNCELMGPANIALLNNNHFQNGGFFGCDVVVGKQDTEIKNAIGFENVSFIGGGIWNATIFIPPQLVPLFRQMGAHFVTLTGDEAPAPQQPQGIGPEKQP